MKTAMALSDASPEKTVAVAVTQARVLPLRYVGVIY